MSIGSVSSESPAVSDGGALGDGADCILELLDKWRHFPAYRLEPRADPFFAAFLPMVLTEHLSNQGYAVDVKHLIPEFPIRKGTVRKGKETNDSNKVDYFAISEDLKKCFLIELKTDEKSINEKQIKFLKWWSTRSWAEIVDGIKSIVCGVRSNRVTRRKYAHLLLELERIHLINVPHIDLLRNLVRGRSIRTDDFSICIENIEPEANPELDVIYVIPKEPCSQKVRDLLRGIDKVNFDQFAKICETKGVIGARFARSLGRWQKQAGLCLPQR